MGLAEGQREVAGAKRTDILSAIKLKKCRFCGTFQVTANTLADGGNDIDRIAHQFPEPA